MKNWPGIAIVMMGGYLLAACSDSDSKSDGYDPIEIGMQTDIQANIALGEERAFVGVNIYDSGRKVTLAGGDLIVARNNDSETLLLGQAETLGFYSNFIDSLTDDSLVDFEVEHRPIEAREDRWYPADQAYVEPGDGPHVGFTFQHQFSFPETIQLRLPENEGVGIG
ncbi:MAG: hypothetical protein GY829_11440 [Gammaproteobacteria bacterium]|nr:hypothetical protein [Gammaproteobacteria bacterium]